MTRRARAQRRVEIAAELVACSGQLSARRVADHLGEPGRVLEADEAPEIVPIGIGRLVRVTLVADRRGQQPVQVTAFGRLVLCRSLALPQAVEIGGRACDMRPAALELAAIARVSVQL